MSECGNTQILYAQIFIKFLLQDKKLQPLQNQQKHTLQQKQVVVGKNLPYELIVNLKSLSDRLSYIVRWSYGHDPPANFEKV